MQKYGPCSKVFIFPTLVQLFLTGHKWEEAKIVTYFMKY